MISVILAGLIASGIFCPIVQPGPHVAPTHVMAPHIMNLAARNDAKHDAVEKPSYAWTKNSYMRAGSPSPNLLILGDSIFDGWSGYILHKFPNTFIDAKVGRQFSSAIPIYRNLLRYRGIQKINHIVVELGTNGAVTRSQIAQFMSLAGNRSVVFIAPKVDRPWGHEVDNLYASLPNYYRNVRVVPWQSISAGHPDYFWADGIHPNWRGIKVMVRSLMAIGVN